MGKNSMLDSVHRLLKVAEEMEMEAEVSSSSSSTLSGEGLGKFSKGVELILTRWTALQLAIHNQWGGPSSSQKAQRFHADIVAFLADSKVPRYIDELEDLLDENMLSSFNTETEDGSVEEVAEQIMIMHEECLDGSYKLFNSLSASPCSASQSVTMCNQIPCEDDEDESEELNEPTTTILDKSHPKAMDVEHVTNESNNRRGGTANNLSEEAVADGWQMTRSKNKRNNRRT